MSLLGNIVSKKYVERIFDKLYFHELVRILKLKACYHDAFTFYRLNSTYAWRSLDLTIKIGKGMFLHIVTNTNIFIHLYIYVWYKDIRYNTPVVMDSRPRTSVEFRSRGSYNFQNHTSASTFFVREKMRENVPQQPNAERMRNL